MRIITGSAKGINLHTLEGDATRPTSARAKEALFSMLQFDVEGRRVLDLFGGSGQLGLDRARVQNADYRNFLRKCKEDGFDLVFLDPPYASDALADALLRLCESGLLHRGCILACESETGGVLEKDARLAEAYTLLKGSHYGRVHIELLTPQAAEV